MLPRPEGANVSTIRELITDISKGQLKLPEFQRGYVWSRDQVRALVESLYRRHPTGHFLVWRTYTPVPTRGVPDGAASSSLLLLDGQQRLTSMYVLMLGEPPPFYEGETLFLDLHFNVATREFRFFQKSLMANDPTWISVQTVLRHGLAALLGRLKELPEDRRRVIQDHLEPLSRLDQIRDYSYHVDELKDDNLTVDEVVEIFSKVNSAGTTLARADLALAHVCASWPEARHELRSFATEMARHGFSIEIEYLIRAIAGTAAQTVNFTAPFYRIPADDLRAAWQKVKKAYEYLVNTLRHYAFIDTIDDFATPLVMVPVLVYLARRNGVFNSNVERDRFIRWMLLANVWSRYAGQTDTKLQRDVYALDDVDPAHRLIEAIVADRGRIAIETKDLEGKGAQTAVYRLGYIVARWRNAQDWFSGATLYSRAIGKSNGLESHHIFPRDVLVKNGFASAEDRKLINEIANRAFLTKRAKLTTSNRYPNAYLPKVEKNIPGALRQQCVPMDPDLWKLANFGLFMHQRRKLLAKQMNQFLNRLAHAEDGAQPVGGIDDLLQKDEGQHLEFKSSLRWDLRENRINKDLERVVVKTVAGFLNAAGGGTLLIGVADDRTVVGLEKDFHSLQKQGHDLRDTFLQHLTNLVGNALGQAEASFLTATCHSVRGEDVCQVTVTECDHPVYVSEGTTTNLYLRQGNLTRPLPLKDAIRYVESRWGGGPKGYMPPLDEAEDLDLPVETEPPEQEADAEAGVEGAGAFANAIEIAAFELRGEMRRLLAWVAQLEKEGLLQKLSSVGGRWPRMIPVPRGERSSFVILYGYGTLYLYRSVLERCAPESIPAIEDIIKPVELGRGRAVKRVPDVLLGALRKAFVEAATRAGAVD
jgi:hypothetical protein